MGGLNIAKERGTSMLNTGPLRSIFVMLLLALALAACGRDGAAAPTPTVDIPIITGGGDVIAEGRLEPGAFAQLSFLTGGQVAEVLVKEGDVVEAGAVLARLENRESLNAQVAQAEQAVFDANQAIRNLSKGLDLQVAQLQQDLARLQDELEKAERRLYFLKTPDIAFYEEELRKAEEALSTAQENAEITSIGDLQAQLDAARDRLKRATDVYNDAQAAQAECPGCDVVFAAAAGTFVKLEDARKEFEDATNAVKVVELRLAQAQRSDSQTIRDLQERVNKARASLQGARNPDQTAIALAEAEVALIKAQLQDGQERLAILRQGPDPDELAAAQARLATAQANLEAARAAFADAELRAPIAGTVAALNLKAGEQASPGVPVITLAEFGRWVVKTNNLTEIEVVKVKEGQPAEVVLDALPEVTLKGVVRSIATVFVESRGDVTYTVTVELGEADPRMRWGMTAQVTLTP